MTLYEYKPLAGRGSEIRLVELLPGQLSDDIHVKIFHASFNIENAPEYEALSYVWGSTENKRKILVRTPKIRGDTGLDGIGVNVVSKDRCHRAEPHGACTLAVTENLHVALRHLRWARETRVFWIDAICINQADLLERSAEVARMREIFSSAGQVVVWLGPESEDSALAVEALETVGEDVKYNEDQRLVTTFYNSPTALLEDDEELLSAKEDEWVAVGSLVQRDWFRRLWIVQEIKLAPEAILCVGFQSLSWHTFKVAFQWVWTYARIFLRGVDVIDYIRIDFILRNFSGQTVRSLVGSTKHSICSDPRDRVFAILSLLHPNLSKGFEPNYVLKPEEVCKNFAKYVIEYEEDLEMLRLCSTPGSSLPSWVPNLTIPNPTTGLGRFRAAGCSKHEAGGLWSDGRLRVQGVQVATINFVSSAISPDAKLQEVLKLCKGWEPKHVDTNHYVGGGMLLDAYMSTLIGGCTEDNMADNISIFPSMEDCRSFLRNCIRGGQLEDLPEGHQLYVNRLMLCVPGRAFFTTDEGYIGLCLADARPGDKVCIVLGCSTPLLLRPRDTHYMMFGESYVHGLMQCEALLGPLPKSWKRKSTSNVGIEFDVWERHGAITHDDPRLGALPSGWRRCFMDNHFETVNSPFDYEGNPRPSGFQDIDSGDLTKADPRFTSTALRARGVDVQEFVIV